MSTSPNYQQVLARAWREEGGQAHLPRYKAKAESKDLDRALELLQGSVDETSLNSSDRPRRMYLLGWALSARYIHTKNLDDLDRAIRLHREALAAIPQDSPDRTTMLNDLSRELYERYERKKDLTDLQEAADTTPTDSPEPTSHSE